VRKTKQIGFQPYRLNLVMRKPLKGVSTLLPKQEAISNKQEENCFLFNLTKQTQVRSKISNLWRYVGF
jgi:hypothetical protein